MTCNFYNYKIGKMTNEERKDFYMNRNIKVLPLYYAFTWDVMFVFTISTLFLTSQKGLSFSQVIMLESFRTLFTCIMCIPISKLFEKVPATTCSRISNLGFIGFLLLSIFGTSYIWFIFAEFFLALAYSIKSVKDNSMLNDSLRLVNRDKDYQRIYGGGLSVYYIAEAIGAIVITYIYNWQPYACYYISLAVVILILLYSFLIKNPEKFEPSNIQINAKVESEIPIKNENKNENIIKKDVKIDINAENIENNKKQNKKLRKRNTTKQKPDGYLKILLTPMFLTMIIYLLFYRGVLAVDTSAFKTYLNILTDNGIIPVVVIGYLFAGVRLCTFISTKYQFKFNLKFGVRSLILFNVLAILTFVINGVTYMIAPASILSLVIISISSIIQSSIRMPNQIFCNNYMQVCLKRKNIERAYAIRSSIEFGAYSMMSFVYAGILELMNNDYGKTNLIYISIFAVPLIISLIVFLRALIKKHTEKYTIIKEEYVED